MYEKEWDIKLATNEAKSEKCAGDLLWNMRAHMRSNEVVRIRKFSPKAHLIDGFCLRWGEVGEWKYVHRRREWTTKTIMMTTTVMLNVKTKWKLLRFRVCLTTRRITATRKCWGATTHTCTRRVIFVLRPSTENLCGLSKFIDIDREPRVLICGP